MASAKRFDAEAHVNNRSPTGADRAIGMKIRALRLAAGMTLRDLGESVGVSFVQFQRYEMGASRISTSRLIAISETLHVGVDRLVAEPSLSEAKPMSYRQRGESGELARLFSAITDSGHRRAIIDLVRAVAAGEEHSHMPPGAVSQNASSRSNGITHEAEQ